MIDYKDFMEITDKEIIYILQDIFKATKVYEINRYSDLRQIDAIIVTEWTGENEGEISEMEDDVTLDSNKIKCYGFAVTSDDILKYKKFMLAKGYSELLKDNKYLNGKSKLD